MKKVTNYLVMLILLFSVCTYAATEITLWHGLSRDPDKSSVDKIVADFERENPDIKVNVVIIPAAETDSTKLITAVAGGTGPDLVYLDRFTVIQRAVDNVLEPMDKYLELAGIDVENFKKEFYDFAIGECIWDNTVWAVPFDTDVRILLYNKKLLRQAGYTEPPKTIYEMIDAAEKLTIEGKRGKYETVGFIPWHGQGWPYTWIYAFEGDIFNAETQKFIFATDPNVIESFEWQKEWADRFGFEELNAFASFQIGDLNAFTAEKLAMIVDGNWTVSGIRLFAPKDFEFGISGIPTKTGEEITWAGGWSFAIPRGAKHPVEAAKLAHYMATKGQVRYSVDTLHLPTYKGAVDAFLQEDPSQKPMVELLKVAKSRPPLPVGALLWDKLNEARDYVLTGKKTVEKALMDAQEEVQKAYDRVVNR